MPDYKKMDSVMFNAVTEANNKDREAELILLNAQRKCEALFIKSSYGSVSISERDENRRKVLDA
jgi:hypothetical protein